MKVLKTIKSMDWVDVFERSAWTFLQVFLATFIIAGESIIDLLFNGNWEALGTLLVATAIAAAAAGLSAVKTILVNAVRELKEQV